MKKYITIGACLLAVPALSRDEVSKDFLLEGKAYRALTFGVYAYTQQEKNDALDAYKRAAEWDPTLARAYFHQATILFEAGQLEEAEKKLLQAAALDKRFFFTFYNLACVAARQGRVEDALGHAETAIKAGYNRFSNFFTDPDLKTIHESEKLKKLVKFYKEKQTQEDPGAAFLLGDRKKKTELLQLMVDKKQQGWKVVAEYALLDSSPELRSMGLILYFEHFQAEESILRTFVRGLFDNNGYVNKTAGNILVLVGEESLPYIEVILSSSDDRAKFYGRQIKAAIEARREAAPKEEKK